MLYYWADTYRRQLKRGDEYGMLNRTISIVILDHEIEALKEFNELGIKWQIRDEKAAMAYAKEHGYKEGLAKGIEDGRKKGLKEGREEGREEGRREGRREGRKEGKEANKIEIAKNMLKEGFSIDMIEKITNLSKEAIEKICLEK